MCHEDWSGFGWPEADAQCNVGTGGIDVCRAIGSEWVCDVPVAFGDLGYVEASAFHVPTSSGFTAVDVTVVSGTHTRYMAFGEVQTEFCCELVGEELQTIDRVRITGTNGGDTIDLFQDLPYYGMAGFPVSFSMSDAHDLPGAPDLEVHVNSLGGVDVLSDSFYVGPDYQEVFDAGSGDDVIMSTAGFDLLDGGDDDDDFVVVGDGAWILGGPGDDEVIATAPFVHAWLGDGDDEFTGTGTGTFIVDGEAGRDTLVGDQGDDILLGGPDNDVLVGGDGADLLDAGPGTEDILCADDSPAGQPDELINAGVLGQSWVNPGNDEPILHGVHSLSLCGDPSYAAVGACGFPLYSRPSACP